MPVDKHSRVISVTEPAKERWWSQHSRQSTARFSRGGTPDDAALGVGDAPGGAGRLTSRWPGPGAVCRRVSTVGQGHDPPRCRYARGRVRLQAHDRHPIVTRREHPRARSTSLRISQIAFVGATRPALSRPGCRGRAVLRKGHLPLGITEPSGNRSLF